ncbi:MAG TPA: lipopolysaccharide heptosyltransferase II [Thermoanaerobaculia bacterium]|jgi:heptosyltransferase-2
MTSRLVIAPNWIGDAVMSLPVLRALRRRHPGDRLAVLARSGPAAVYRAEGSADQVLGRGALLPDARRARAGEFDEVWLLPNSFRAALLALLSRAPRRLGYATDRRGALLTEALPPPPGTEHQLRDYDALLLHAGVPPDTDPPALPIPPTERARAALSAASVPAGFVVLCPGSATAPEKRWPATRYAALAGLLAATEIPCVVAVGPSERELGRTVSAASPVPLPVIGADLDPMELAGLLSLARAVVSNDSGPAHLAAAVGTPTVVLFGPTDPRRTAPVPAGGRVRVLERMGDVKAEDAARAVEETLRG